MTKLLKDTFREVFRQIYPEIEHRVEQEGKGLTLRQSKVLLYMVQFLKGRETILTNDLQRAKVHLVHEQEDRQSLVIEWNTLTDNLAKQFGFKVSGELPEGYKSDAPDKPEGFVWIAEFPDGTKLPPQKTMAMAFIAGIQAAQERRSE